MTKVPSRLEFMLSWVFLFIATCVFSGPAIAIENNTTNSQPHLITAPYRDFRHIEPFLVGVMAGKATKGTPDTTVIVIYDNTDEKKEAVFKGVRGAQRLYKASIGLIAHAKGSGNINYWFNGQNIDISSIVENWNEMEPYLQTQATLHWITKKLAKK